MATTKFTSIDAYHASFPPEVQAKLESLRMLIKEIIPDATDVISYNIPAFRLKKVVVYYAAFKHHLSIFPAPGGPEWEEDFAPYHTSGKGTIRFSMDQPLPVELIQKIVRYRARISQ